MNESRLILGIGELLWDLLPEGNALGGAPANFAVMASQLGNRAAILSRIGQDDLGRKASERLKLLPLGDFLQRDSDQPTGQVTVEFVDGQPMYTIHQPAAWDFLELTESWTKLAEQADAICFGSLAQRSPASRQTIQALVARTSPSCLRVFDVNLRPPFCSGEVIRESLQLATVFKMNDAETPRVLALLGLTSQPDHAPDYTSATLRQSAERLLDKFPSLRMVAITRGAHGSILVTRKAGHEHPGLSVNVADTIGAGDAFTAALTHYLLRGADLATLNEAGNRWGAWVASQAGAMPSLPETMRMRIESQIAAARIEAATES
ncbi:MAG: carbohydrate kinase [Terracidiphilus sp.]